MTKQNTLNTAYPAAHSNNTSIFNVYSALFTKNVLYIFVYITSTHRQRIFNVTANIIIIELSNLIFF